MPTVSVIVPVYNVEKYIHRCVDSILEQTFSDFELILVDDGSPDNCPSICDEYAAKDSRIRVIHQENRGLSAARNGGMDAACGTYLMFVDSDDWLRKDTLEIFVNCQKKTGADMVLCNILTVYPDGYSGWKRPVTPLTEKVMTRGEMVECLASEHNWYYCVAWNKLYKRVLFEKLRFPEGYIHEDEAIIHRVVGECSCIAVTPEPLYFYRQSTDSITGRGIRIQSMDKLHALADRILFCKERNWMRLMAASMEGYTYWVLKFCSDFARTPETELYFRRMDDGLREVLPDILKAKSVSARHKLYLLTIWINPRIYSRLKRMLKG